MNRYSRLSAFCSHLPPLLTRQITSFRVVSLYITSSNQCVKGLPIISAAFVGDFFPGFSDALTDPLLECLSYPPGCPDTICCFLCFPLVFCYFIKCLKAHQGSCIGHRGACIICVTKLSSSLCSLEIFSKLACCSITTHMKNIYTISLLHCPSL